jgi:predicted nucleic acid-binding protein
VLVVDANIAVKWFSNEDDSVLALEITERKTLLYAPELIQWEVLAGICKNAKKSNANADVIKDSCQQWFDFLDNRDILIWDNKSLQSKAIDLSVSLQHQFQDCLYLALAMELDAELITADKTFAKRAMSCFSRISFLHGNDQL